MVTFRRWSHRIVRAASSLLFVVGLAGPAPAQSADTIKVWLPRASPAKPTGDVLDEFRIVLFRGNGVTTRQLGVRRVDSDEEFARLLGEVRDDLRKLKMPDVPCVIDADGTVPWRDVINVVELGTKAGINKIEFASAAPPPAKVASSPNKPNSPTRDDFAKSSDSGPITINVLHRRDPEIKCPGLAKGQPCTAEDHWLVEIDGHECPKDAATARLTAAAIFQLEPPQPGRAERLSARTVVIRADDLAPFGIVHQLIESCATSGLYKLEVGRAKPPAVK